MRDFRDPEFPDLPERCFETHDSLGRRQYADLLLNLIQNSDKYKRDSDSDSYVIAVDSPWGSGKTYFFDMFHNLLMGRKFPADAPDECSKFHVVRYNAWKNDFWDNAFEPFILEMTQSPFFLKSKLKEVGKEIFERLTKTAVQVIYGYGTSIFREKLGDDAVENIQEIWGEGGRSEIAPELQVAQYQQGVLKKALEDFIMATAPGDKLVVIIDELDRCRPTFAIQTLEIVKHFLDVPDIVYIFAVDINQLSHSVRTVYGQGMDAAGYICRFFDFISKMPPASVGTIIKNNMLRDDEAENKNDQCIPEDMEKYFKELVHIFDLSLRELNTFMQNYKLMYDIMLKNYHHPSAHYFYSFLLAMKYKKQEDFTRLFTKEGVSEIKEKYALIELREKVNLGLSCLARNLDIDLKNIYFNHEEVCQNVINKIRVSHYVTTNLDYDYSGVLWYRTTSESQQNASAMEASIASLDHLFFAPDLARWESIQSMTLGEYIQQQLEVFNFWESGANAERMTAEDALAEI